MTVKKNERVRLNRDTRRALILNQALELVGERGYMAFSLAELARRCGLTDAGLLHHVGSKAALLIELLQYRDTLDEAALTTAFAAVQSSGHRTLGDVSAALHSIVGRNARQPALVRLYATLRAEALTAHHPAHGFFREREAKVRRLFAAMVAPVVSDAEEVSRQLTISMHGLEDQWVRDDGDFDLLAAWDALAAKLLR